MNTSNINNNSSSSNINNSSILYKKRKHTPTKFYHNSDYCKGNSSTNKKIKHLSKPEISIPKSTCCSSDDSSESSSVVLLPPIKKEIEVVDLCGPNNDESINNESSSSNERIQYSSSAQQQDEYQSPVGNYLLVSERQLFFDEQRRDAHQQNNDMLSQYDIDNTCEYDNEEYYVSPCRSPVYPSAENHSYHDEENVPLEQISQVDKVENNVKPPVQEEQKNQQQENPVFRTYSNYFYR